MHMYVYMGVTLAILIQIAAKDNIRVYVVPAASRNGSGAG